MDRYKTSTATNPTYRTHARDSAAGYQRAGVRVAPADRWVAHHVSSAYRSTPFRGHESARAQRRGLGMDHRQGNRYRVFRLVEVQYADAGRAPGLLYNVSRNGMFVLTSAQPGMNGCVDIRIHAANDGEAVRISAQVVHHNGCGVGLIFRDLVDHAGGVIEGLCAS